MEEITKMVEYVKTIKGDKYAPLVTTPWEMWTKYAKLKDYQLKNSVQAPSPVIKPKGYAELRSAAYIFKRDWYKHKNYDGDDGQTYFRFKGENREEWWKMCPSEQQSVAEIFVGIESTPKTSLAQLNEVLSVFNEYAKANKLSYDHSLDMNYRADADYLIATYGLPKVVSVAIKAINQQKPVETIKELFSPCDLRNRWEEFCGE